MTEKLVYTNKKRTVEIVPDKPDVILRMKIVVDGSTLATFDLSSLYDLIYSQYMKTDCKDRAGDDRRKAEMMVGRNAFSEMTKVLI